jgi:hypothetical protein
VKEASLFGFIGTATKWQKLPHYDPEVACPDLSRRNPFSPLCKLQQSPEEKKALTNVGHALVVYTMQIALDHGKNQKDVQQGAGWSCGQRKVDAPLK